MEPLSCQWDTRATHYILIYGQSLFHNFVIRYGAEQKQQSEPRHVGFNYSGR